jgi:MFS family permease
VLTGIGFSCAAMFLDLMNLSAVTIALPTIQKDLNVDVGSLQWIISAYALTVREIHH